MKSIRPTKQKLVPAEIEPSIYAAGPSTKVIQDTVARAIARLGHGIQLWLQAGQLLSEKKKALGYGVFGEWREKYFPDVPERTLQRYTKAAEAILKRLPPPPAIEIEVSIILSAPPEQLPPDAQQYRQAWLDFTSQQKIVDCASGLFVEDKPNALNGAIAGGSNQGKGYQDYIGNNFGKISRLFKRSHKKRGPAYIKYTPSQKQATVESAKQSIKDWPLWFLNGIASTVNEERKLTEEQRLARVSQNGHQN